MRRDNRVIVPAMDGGASWNVWLTWHAIERYIERVQPDLDDFGGSMVRLREHMAVRVATAMERGEVVERRDGKAMAVIHDGQRWGLRVFDRRVRVQTVVNHMESE